LPVAILGWTNTNRCRSHRLSQRDSLTGASMWHKIMHGLKCALTSGAIVRRHPSGIEKDRICHAQVSTLPDPGGLSGITELASVYRADFNRKRSDNSEG
jgi:hypothetical protein